MNRLQFAVIALHRGVYRATRGRVAGRFGKAPMLLLTTRGRRSGQERTHPLLYLRDGASLVVIASAGGQPAHPAWYLNLVADPAVRVQIGADIRSMTARTATPEERSRLWPAVLAIYPTYADYQRRTSREIPVVILEPV